MKTIDEFQFSRALIAVSGLILAVPAIAARTPVSADGPVKIELSHQLDTEQAKRLESWIEQFNKQQKSVQIRLVRRAKGDTAKPLNLVTREEYATFLMRKARFEPLHEVMRKARTPLDSSKILPELGAGLSDAKGRLFALPVAFSTPVLYINKVAFRKAELNPDTPPKTWSEMQNAAGKLAASGSLCPYTTSWPAWVLIDNISAWNGADVNDAKGNLSFNGKLQVKHIAMMATWHKSKYFIYSGRRDEADRRFANGECGMLTSSSSLFPRLADKKNVVVGVAPLPFHDDEQGTPKNTLADGASLWVARGLNPTKMKGVAKFVDYVLSPEVQAEITLASGFLPMTQVARTAASSTLMKADLAWLQVAYSQLQGKAASPAVRVSQIEAVRIIVEEELEKVWANKKSAKAALDDAVQRGNAVMKSSVGEAKRRTTEK